MEKMSGQKPSGTASDYIRSMNEKHAEKREPQYTLLEMLASRSLTALRKMASLHGVRGYTKMGKPETVMALNTALTDPELLREVLLLLEISDWLCFQKAAEVKEMPAGTICSEDYMAAMAYGLMRLYYFNGKYRCVVPAEIRKSFGKLKKEGLLAEKERSDLLRSYAVAAVNLYGVVARKELVEIFNLYEERKTGFDEMYEMLRSFSSMGFGFALWERDSLVHEAIVGDPDEQFRNYEEYDAFIQALSNEAAGKPRYLPPRKKFLRYSNLNYIEETLPLSLFRDYLGREVLGDTDKAADITDTLALNFRRGVDYKSALKFLEDKGALDTDFKRAEALVNYMVIFYNNTRIWANHGYTPDELYKKCMKSH